MANKSNRRLRLWKKFKNCFVCLRPISTVEECTIEHIIPKSKGGTNTFRNLGVSHSECNRQRGNILCRLVWMLKQSEDPDHGANYMDTLKQMSPRNIMRAWKKKNAGKDLSERSQEPF